MSLRRPDRRHFLSTSTGLVVAAATLPWVGTAMADASALPAQGMTTPQRQASETLQRALAFNHTHTHERISVVYAAEGAYLPAALIQLNRFLRDHYAGTVGRMDPQLFDLLHQLRARLGGTSLPPFEVISGYRSPLTNGQLRQSRGGGVAKHSLHMEGRAIDIRLPGVPLAELRDAALSLQAGGVGYYPQEQFVHVDTGRVRSWG